MVVRTKSIIFRYSEWLDQQGLVISDRDGDARTHEELVSQFMTENPDIHETHV